MSKLLVLIRYISRSAGFALDSPRKMKLSIGWFLGNITGCRPKLKRRSSLRSRTCSSSTSSATRNSPLQHRLCLRLPRRRRQGFRVARQGGRVRRPRPRRYRDGEPVCQDPRRPALAAVPAQDRQGPRPARQDRVQDAAAAAMSGVESLNRRTAENWTTGRETTNRGILTGLFLQKVTKLTKPRLIE